MRMPSLVTVVAVSFAAAEILAQQPAKDASPAPGPTFEVVSIRPNTTDSTSMSMRHGDDGRYSMVNGSVRSIVASAYPGMQADPVGLPDWVTSERYDVTATVTVRAPVTSDDRRAMLRAMLAERFNFAAHIEVREFPAYDLVLARSDGRLGPNMKTPEVDCEARIAEARAAAEKARAAGTAPPLPRPAVPFTPPAPGSPVQPCSIRMIGNLIEGDVTMASLAGFIRGMAGRHVVDKTGLEGYFRIRLEALRSVQGPTLEAHAAEPAAVASVFTALPEQLGLKLEPSRTNLEVLVVDRMDRPSEN